MPPRSRSQVDGPIRYMQVITNTSSPVLMLPPEFVRLYGDEVPNDVTFISPTGRKWVVVTSDAGGGRSFGDGWPQFRDHYEIRSGYYILFCYNRRSIFHTTIFDTSDINIIYPSDISDAEDDEEAVLDGQIPANVAAEAVRSNVTNMQRLKVDVEGDTTSLRMAALFTSNIPEGTKFFLKELTVTDVTGCCQMIIPKKTANKIFSLMRTAMMVTVRDGDSFPINFTVVGGITRVSSGWKAVVNAYHLKASDVVVFVLHPTTNV